MATLTIIFGILKIGFVSHNLLFLIDFFLSAQKTSVSASGGVKRKKQNIEFRIQNSEDSKHKSQNHKKIHSVKSEPH
jgi:hypothetical protein